MLREMRKEEVMSLWIHSLKMMLLLTGMAALGAETYHLHFNPKQGEVRNFESRVILVQKAEIFPGGSLTQDIHIKSKQKTREVNPDGSFLLEVIIEEMTIDMAGTKNKLEEAIIGKTLLMVANSEGRVTEVRQPEGLDQKSLQLFGQMKQKFMTEHFDYPKDPIEIGAVWEAPYVGSMDTGNAVMDYVGQKKYKLLAVKSFRGRICLEIEITGSYDIIVEQGDGGQMKATIHTITLMDQESGVSVGLTGDEVVVGERITSNGAMKIEVNTHMEFTEAGLLRGN